MENSEALMIRKSDYGEADYMIDFFTREFGKIRGIAKNAKKSRKRFGGRLELFIHLRVGFRSRTGGIKFIEDSEVVGVFSSLMEDIELFTWGNFVLENINILLPEEEPNEKIFDLAVETLRALDSRRNSPGAILEFQLSILELSGYKPNFDQCIGCGETIETNSSFSIKKGGVYCGNCRLEEADGFILRDVSAVYGCAEENKEVFDRIKLLAKFTEYHAGKQLKSTKFLEEIRR